MEKLASLPLSIFTALIFLAVSYGSARETSGGGEILIYPYEADEDLEENLSSSLSSSLSEFKAKGGTLIRLEGNQSPFVFAPGDVVFPSCSGGNNRSQTLWGVLQRYSDEITVMPPHATRYGFDPYNGLSNWNRTHHTQKSDEFVLWAGVCKTKKFGWQNFEKLLSRKEGTKDELNALWEYYSSNYYNPDFPEGIRRVYITFAKNAHVHLFRLNQTNASLENVVVLFFPVEDLIAKPLPDWKTYPRSVKAYTELAKILQAYLL